MSGGLEQPARDRRRDAIQRQKNVGNEILAERRRQDKKWGEQNHRPEWWMQILMEEVGEAAQALLNAQFNPNGTYEVYRKEMIQVAAVALAAIESFDRNKW
jgi:NTP pyrophosphatase (non-canonical NTP hydrolase)